MYLVSKVRDKWRSLWRDETARQVEELAVRAKPAQDIEAASWAWIPSPDFAHDMAAYVFREWISTAIDRVAEIAVSVPLGVRMREGMEAVDHPLLEMIGSYGQPNDAQDSLEFMEAHFQRCDVFGNDIWYWSSASGGAPDEVYQLDPRRIRIEAGSRRTVGKYIYTMNGQEIVLSPEQITHFRRSNIVESGMYWGISALQKLRNVIESDKAMTWWNRDFFSTGAPSGVLIVDSDSVSAEAARQMEHEIHSQVSEKRRMIVIRAKPGSAVWNDAALRHRELEFENGRLITRQAAFDALGFHVGAVSEASTEAHARVAERFVRNSAYARHMRSASKLNRVLRYWGNWDKYMVRFEDVRTVDWQQESMKLKAVEPFMTINEVRTKYLDLRPVEWGEQKYERKSGKEVGQDSSGASGEPAEGAGRPADGDREVENGAGEA